MKRQSAPLRLVRKLALFAGVLVLGTAANAEVWHTARIKNVYPQADGRVVVIFQVDAAACAGTPGNKYHYIAAGISGVTTEGVRMMLATLLTALAMDRNVSAAFDETSSPCYINRLMIRE
jgi:hypothetical protein